MPTKHQPRVFHAGLIRLISFESFLSVEMLFHLPYGAAAL